MKKSLCLLFALLLLLPCLGSAEEAGVSVRFPSTAPGGWSRLTLTMDEHWFSRDAAEYNHELCKLSLGLAMAAFRVEDRESPDADILRFFADLGFSSPQTLQYDVMREDTIATAMAWRYVGGLESPVPLVVIGVCGGYDYGDEWFNNFDIDDGDVHRGFLVTAQKVVDRAREYLKDNGLDGEPVRFWISGYSRGAAVSNLTAALLSEEGLSPDERVYAYTFATPRTVRGEGIGAHPNIFNIVNPNDLVPRVPPAAWGYGWYGRTLFLPSSLDQNQDYASLLPAYAEAYRALTGRSDAPGDQQYAGIAAAAAQGMASVILSPALYTDAYRTLLSKFITGRALDAADSLLAMGLVSGIARSVSLWRGEEVNLLHLFDMEQAGKVLADIGVALSQHYPEYYAAWLWSLPDGEALQNSSLTLTGAPTI